MLKTVRVSEASWRVMKEHSKDLKVWREELRTIAGSRTRKAEPPPEISGDLEEGVIRGKLCREYTSNLLSLVNLVQQLPTSATSLRPLRSMDRRELYVPRARTTMAMSRS